MATPTQQPEFQSSEQIRELLIFLRQESEANKEHLRNQAEADRQLLKHTLWIVAVPLTALISVAAFLGFRSVSDLKDSIRTQAQTETKVEINRMQADTEKQIKAMQSEIRNRLDDQFKSPVIRGLVKEAAKEQTQITANPLIQSEVAKQVKNGVAAEQGNIRHTVTEQTQAAVKQMGTQIDMFVKDAVDAKVQTQVRPVENQIATLMRETELQQLINRMNADDAQAFDILNHLPLNSLSPDQQRLIMSALKNVAVTHSSGIHLARMFNNPLSDDQLIAELSDAESLNREAALDTLANKKILRLLPKVVEILQHDSSVDVRTAAYRLFDAWTGQNFQVLFDEQRLVLWWNQHQKEVLP